MYGDTSNSSGVGKAHGIDYLDSQLERKSAKIRSTWLHFNFCSNTSASQALLLLHSHMPNMRPTISNSELDQT